MIPLLVTALSALAGIEVTLAPDQPLPYVYVDEPLIVEFESSSKVQVQVRATLAREGQAPQEIDLGPMHLMPGGTTWRTLEDLPEARGLYTLTLDMRAAEQSETFSDTFCRIDRETAAPLDWVVVDVDRCDDDTLRVLRALGVGRLRLEGPADGFEATLGTALAEAKLRLTLRLARLDEATLALLRNAVAQQQGSRIELVELEAGDSAAQWVEAAGALRDLGLSARRAAILRDTAQLDALLEAGAGPLLDGLVLDASLANRDTVRALRSSGESFGYEGIPIFGVSGVASAEENFAAMKLTHELFRQRALGAQTSAVAFPSLYDGRRFGAMASCVSGLTHATRNIRYVGPYAAAGAPALPVFRKGAQWLLVLEGRETPEPRALPLPGAQNLSVTDAQNNPVPFTFEADSLAVELAGTPLLVFGSGGDVMRLAARAMAREEASALATRDGLLELLGEDEQSVTRALAEAGGEKIERRQFFLLLRQFPELERRWHAGEIPAGQAVPLLGGLGRLIRALCVIEQESDEAFLERLDDMLARCNEYQILYVTGSGAAGLAPERGDWLLAEVNRLSEEARALEEDGRPIEADGVAALAEWRARSLEHAIRARPLSPR